MHYRVLILFQVPVKAFDLELLNQVVNFKDTESKAPLTVHLVKLVVDTFPDSTDLHTELPNVHSMAKVRFTLHAYAFIYVG